VGEFAARNTPDLALVRGRDERPLTGANAKIRPANMPASPPNTLDGVEAAVSAEIEAMGAHLRPGLAATALALARILDNPKALGQQPAAAKVLAALLEKLRSASARRRRGSLAVVRNMTEKGGA
jgi:hypothetical protein